MEAEHLTPYPALAATLFRDDTANKTVLITGGGYGLGPAIASAFAQASAKEVILVGRTRSRLDSTVASLSKEYPSTKFTPFTVDISSPTDVAHLFKSLSQPADILINNAGFLTTPSSFLKTDLAEFWESFTTNVYGTAQVTQKFLQHREANKPANTAGPAVVINVNTLAAYTVRVPNISAYAASKSALARWTELLQEEFSASSDVRFISVHPGAVETDMAIKSGLAGVFPYTAPQLAAEFILWATTEEAAFLAGRFAWVNWDKEKLVEKREEIVGRDLLRTSLSGGGL
jgi:short-subunit dehydrogenase